MNAADIAKALGGHQNGKGWVARCPAHEDRTPSLSINDDGGKVLVKCFAGCEQGRVIDALKASGLWPQKRKAPPPTKQAWIPYTWDAALPIDGTPADRYLRSRGIDPAKLPGGRWPPTLRWHPKTTTKVQGDAAPIVYEGAMVARFHEFAIFRTFLMADGRAVRDADGKKLTRMLGSDTERTGIKLGTAPDPDGRWGIAEGIETALSAAQIYGHPVTAAYSAGNMPKVRPPEWARRITIFADHDNAGLKAAGQTLRAYRDLALEVRVLRPAVDKADFNDVLVNGGDVTDATADMPAVDTAAPAEDEIAELNKEYATAWAGANYVIIREHTDEHGKDVTSIITKESFDLAHKDRFVQVDDKIYPLTDVWFRSPRRRRYKGVIFAPDRAVPDYFNLWKGWGVGPDPAPRPEERCKLFLAHTRDVICDGDDELNRWTLAWLADGVQDIPVKKGTALALKGSEGIGKGIWARYYGLIFGAHFKQLIQTEHLVGRFNEHQKDMLLCFADECFYAGDPRHAGLLKGFITEGKKMIEPKFVGAFEIDDCARLIMATNNEWAVPAGPNARRFAMLKVSDAHDEDAPYFDALTHEMSNGGPAALMAYLKAYDVKPFNLRRAPKTKALLEQKVLSMTPEQGWLYDMLMRGRLPGQHGDIPWTKYVVCDDMHNDYVKRIGRLGNSRKAHETLLAGKLRSMAPGPEDEKLKRTEVSVPREVQEHPNAPPSMCSVRKTVWLLPDLKTWRAHFEELLGQPVDWPEDEEPQY